VIKKRAVIALFVLCLTAFSLTGCGYHISGKSGKMPEDIKALTIPVFVNATTKPDIEGIITSSFISEFVTTVNVNDEAAYVMNGVITSYSLNGVSFTGKDITQEYRLSVSVSVNIKDKKDGRIIWENKSIKDYEDFKVDTADVTHTEEVEIASFKKLTKDMARIVKERMLEGF